MSTEYPGAKDPEVQELVEQVIPFHLKAALYDVAKVYQIDSMADWPLHPDLGPFFEHVAFRILEDRERRRGASAGVAREEACRRLRLSPKAKRKKKWRDEKSYREAKDGIGTECPKTREKSA